MGLLLVRYAEMGLKSRPVRQRFERLLLDNMQDLLASRGVEALVSSEQGRVFVRVDDDHVAIDIISRVFGVSSLSPVVGCRADLEELGRVAAEMSIPLMPEGGSFAVRARREGVHPFTSVDLAREVGAAIWRANQGRGVRVDLKRPDLEIFVEVRSSRGYVFHRIVPGPGGLPLASQGKVLAFVERREDTLAAWLMMKRGCRTAVVTSDPALCDWLRGWDPALRVEDPSNTQFMMERWGALGTVHGHVFEEMEAVLRVIQVLPAFFPLIGMDPEEIERRLRLLG